ncbi:hypothetical protein [Qipengyuania aquimaris]|uniref:Glycosyltransferase RgtA/B/C/D-like domain-containing protein n=1 Tax=Qipengyuania aquimaris TaxID=255984 RepID=A0A9Q3XCI8_9SPHN|nr:hypothetical protein [Qipengyuania aquimaris]MBY6218092.1 hypothetical protein [Qipengyuania aquimaris]
MNSDMPRNSSIDLRPHWALSIVFIISFISVMTLSWLPIEFTIGRFIYDDMFYYLKVAQNIAEGYGSTFDGVSPTNGYHPAWMAISTILALFLSDDLLVHGVLMIAGLLHVGQGIVLSRILARWLRPWLVVALCALYLLNWRTLAINLCGLETALATFIVLIVADRLLLRPVAQTWKDGVLAGFLLGFAILCRFDLLLLAAFVAVVIGLTWWLREGASFGKALLTGLSLPAGALAVLTPWFIFSWEVSGSLLPNSRKAVGYLTEIKYDLGNPAQVLDQINSQAWSFFWWSSDIANLFGILPIVAPTDKGMILSGLLLCGLALFVLVRLWMSRAERSAQFGLILLGYFAVHFGYYLVFHRVEMRYVLPVIALFFVPLGIAIELSLGRAGAHRIREKAVTVVGATAFMVATATGVIAFQRGYASVRAHMYHYVALDMAMWLSRERPEALPAAWNAGILGYFSKSGLVNLDGVINDDSLAAIEEGELAAFIRDRGITLIVDEPGQIESNLDRFAGQTDWKEWLGPVVHTSMDDEGRMIVAREVRFK